MTAVLLPPRLSLGFELDEAHEAHEPPEVRGIARDGVRMLVSRGVDPPEHRGFRDLPSVLQPGDLLVVNTSGTVPAAADATLPDGGPVVVHLSTRLPAGLWMVEPRTPQPGGATTPRHLDVDRTTLRLVDGTTLDLLRRAPGSDRLWIAAPAGDAADTEPVDLLARVTAVGRPIRYGYVRRDWGLGHYQTVFAEDPGSAEMPSAARPFTPEVVTALVRRGIGVVPITLHTGVSSLEGHELPYPERYRVPAATAAAVNATRAGGGHVVAVGTTVVRALESTIDEAGVTHPGAGWTDLVITPSRGTRAVDGLLTGWHEPEATHLAMLEAVAGREALEVAYEEAFATGYLWHEFGDSHLLLPYAGGR